MNEVIHLAANVVLSAYTYTQVYASVTATPTINGTVVSLVAGAFLPILVQSITPTANVYCVGRIRLISPQIING